MADAATTTATPAAPATTPPPAATTPPPATQGEVLSAQDIKAKNELKKEMQRVSDARAALAKDKAEVDEYRREESMLAVDPDSFLKKRLGEKWYETLTKAKLGDDSSLAVQQLRNEFEAKFKAQQDAEAARVAEETQRLEQEREQTVEEARVALEEFRTEATTFVKEKPDDYQAIHALKLEASVAEKAQSHFNQTKKVLSHKEAADLLESELDKAVEAVLATKKWQEKLGKKSEPTKPTQPPQLVVPRSAPTTLDNGMRAGAAPVSPQRLTKEQKYEKAMARLAEWEAEKAKSQAQ